MNEDPKNDYDLRGKIVSRWDDFKRPVNIVALSVAFVSLILSIFFYYISQKTREPTYLVSEDIVQIYDNSISSPSITLIDKDSNAIKDDIYLITVTFWNKGKLPIEPEDVRLPITASISPIRRLLDYSIQKQTNPEVAKFGLSLISEPTPEKPSAKIQINWDHLDPNHGVKFQIIYAGDSESKISFDGSIVGVEEIQTASPLLSDLIVNVVFMIISGLTGGLLFSAKTLIFNRDKRELKSFLLFVAAIIFLLLILILFFGDTSPPL